MQPDRAVRLKFARPGGVESSMNTGLLLDPAYQEHDPGPGHPENPGRYAAVMNALEASGLLSKLKGIPSRLAEKPELQLCHPARYIDLVRREVEEDGLETLSTGDTDVCGKSHEIALRAVGGVLNAVDEVMSGRLTRAFCAVRPPGHHASAEKGMGFCLFNNIALGARHAQRKHGASKVAVVDWDVHHGNGTQDLFYEDGSVFFASTHQSPWYPFTGHAEETGKGKGAGATLNLPMAAGAGIQEFSKVFEERLLPALDAFKPDLILISAGFDSRIHDPLGRFRLTDGDFALLTRHLRGLADMHCGGRLVSVLEGGYNLDGLGSAVSAHVGALL
ncbi:MAG: Histone deacetylase-like amidohydrolase [Prosthecobacter sp.]|nr:Histone deacetylase-like amidohydrolase [Prosthecobacter sp.]